MTFTHLVRLADLRTHVAVLAALAAATDEAHGQIPVDPNPPQPVLQGVQPADGSAQTLQGSQVPVQQAAPPQQEAAPPPPPPPAAIPPPPQQAPPAQQTAPSPPSPPAAQAAPSAQSATPPHQGSAPPLQSQPTADVVQPTADPQTAATGDTAQSTAPAAVHHPAAPSETAQPAAPTEPPVHQGPPAAVPEQPPGTPPVETPPPAAPPAESPPPAAPPAAPPADTAPSDTTEVEVKPTPAQPDIEVKVGGPPDEANVTQATPPQQPDLPVSQPALRQEPLEVRPVEAPARVVSPPRHEAPPETQPRPEPRERSEPSEDQPVAVDPQTAAELLQPTMRVDDLQAAAAPGVAADPQPRLETGPPAGAARDIEIPPPAPRDPSDPPPVPATTAAPTAGGGGRRYAWCHTGSAKLVIGGQVTRCTGPDGDKTFIGLSLGVGGGYDATYGPPPEGASLRGEAGLGLGEKGIGADAELPLGDGEFDAGIHGDARFKGVGPKFEQSLRDEGGGVAGGGYEQGDRPDRRRRIKAKGEASVTLQVPLSFFTDPVVNAANRVRYLFDAGEWSWLIYRHRRVW